MQLNGFDANTIEPNTAYEPLPAGWYECMIISSEEKPTKAMTGSYLQLGLQVVSGPSQNRQLIDRLNLNNPNSTAVDIAQRTLSAICRAVGVFTPSDSSELHDKPLMVKVAVKAASGDYSASNEVKGYEAVNANKPATSAGAGAPPTPPWKR